MLCEAKRELRGPRAWIVSAGTIPVRFPMERLLRMFRYHANKLQLEIKISQELTIFTNSLETQVI